MSEGIEYNTTGTVDVTFDDKTYHLGRPKFKQWKYFTRKLNEQRDELTAALQRIQRETEEAEAKYKGNEDSPEAREELRRLRDELAEINKTPFYDRTVTILAEMFSQVGDPLPDDPDDWPAWLAADSSIPGEIIKHWRNNPKASGANGNG